MSRHAKLRNKRRPNRTPRLLAMLALVASACSVPSRQEAFAGVRSSVLDRLGPHVRIP